MRLQQSVASGRVLLAQVDQPFRRFGEGHRDQDPLEEEMGAELHHEAVLDRSRLTLVGVHHDVARAWLARDRFPLDPGREAGASVAREPRRLELFDDVLRWRRAAQELEAAARCVVGERLVTLPEPDRRPVVRRMRHRRDDLVAPRHDRGEVAVTETCDLDRVRVCSRGARVLRSSRRRARCRRGESRPGPAGTSRTRRPRGLRPGGCSCGRRAHPRARG